jgi:hypothetical protein
MSTRGVTSAASQAVQSPSPYQINKQVNKKKTVIGGGHGSSWKPADPNSGGTKPTFTDVSPLPAAYLGEDCLFNLPPHAWSLPMSQHVLKTGNGPFSGEPGSQNYKKKKK